MPIRNPASERSGDASALLAPALAALTPAGASAWLGMMTECGSFIARRFEEDLKTQQALLSCKNPSDVLQVQAAYYKTAVDQYSAEASRIVGMISGALGGSSAKHGSLFARGYDDIPV